MEDKTGFERLVNTSQSNIIPKRLSFDFPNNITEMSSKKRKMENASMVFSEDRNDSTKTFNDTLNISVESVSSVTAAPWEMKMLRIDLNEAQTRVSTEIQWRLLIN